MPDDAMVAADFPVPPDRDLLALARQLRWNGVEPNSQPARFADGLPEVGHTTSFWTLDYPRSRMVSKEFVLAAVSEHAYWWIEQGLDVDESDLQRSVADVEGQIYPRVTAAFGAAPGSAADPQRGHIINGRIPGVGGYVSGADPYPPSVQPYSNGVPAIYINAREIPLGSPEYLTVLAHELQHAIHWYADAAEATWLNEGLSELAVTEAGYSPGSMRYYLRRPNSSLVNWPKDLDSDIGLNYGAASLFAHYLRERHVPEGGLPELLAGPRNGIAAVDAFLAQQGAETAGGEPAGFHSVFADWMVANLLDADEGEFGYAGLDVEASITRTQRVGDEGATVSLPQYGIDYVEVKGIDKGAVIRFEADGVTPILPDEPPDGGCWWTNRGDDTSTTLTRSVTVPTVASASTTPALTFELWHDIEEDWDYLYVEASTDNGETWDVLPAEGTTDANPLGNSYGHGYTGSGGWKEVAVPLADYAGREALLRFHYVTDDAIHGTGACLGDVALSWEADSAPNRWEPDGFVLINNRVLQEWIVWVISDNAEPTVERMPLHWDHEREKYVGRIGTKAADGDGRVVLAISPVAPATMERARYRVWAIEAAPGPPSGSGSG
ncbi:MAG: immune inhibitor A [Chloroflexota bacterium]|nr:immune inhibitor A [Chloroflexota bacterium]MDE2959783.1 immune inhibitor A [Chloroflexota bacterium]